MKPTHRIVKGATAAFLALSLHSAELPYDGSPAASATGGHSTRNQANEPSQPLRVDGLIGKPIKNARNEKVGSVDDLILDVEAGRVALVIVETGGVLGVNSRKTAVPPAAIKYEAALGAMRLTVDLAKLSSAPEVDPAIWDQAGSSTHLNDTYRYFGMNPYAAEMRVQETTVIKHGPMKRATKLIGFKVVNVSDEKVGAVDNLVVDLPTGRVLYVVVNSGGFLGIGDAMSAMPPRALRYVPDATALQTRLDREQLTSAPYFKSSEWPDFEDADYSVEVGRAYGVHPYFHVDADNTARNNRDIPEDRLTPLDQGNSEKDVRITQRIRRAVLEADRLSINARNVKIITVDGRVTLRGPVDKESEKEMIAEIAQAVAPNGVIVNQIEVVSRK